MFKFKLLFLMCVSFLYSQRLLALGKGAMQAVAAAGAVPQAPEEDEESLEAYYNRLQKAKEIPGANMRAEREKFRAYLNQRMQSNQTGFASELKIFRDKLNREQHDEFEYDLNESGAFCTTINCQDQMKFKFSSYNNSTISAHRLDRATENFNTGIHTQEERESAEPTDAKIMRLQEEALRTASVATIKVIAEDHPDIYKQYAAGNRDVLEGFYGLKVDEKTFNRNVSFIKTKIASGELPNPLLDCSSSFVSPKCVSKEEVRPAIAAGGVQHTPRN